MQPIAFKGSSPTTHQVSSTIIRQISATAHSKPEPIVPIVSVGRDEFTVSTTSHIPAPLPELTTPHTITSVRTPTHSTATPRSTVSGISRVDSVSTLTFSVFDNSSVESFGEFT